jgi:hypothetical protein
MRPTRLVVAFGIVASLSARRAAAQACYMVRDRDTAFAASNPLTGVTFPYGQSVQVYWRAGSPRQDITAYPGFATDNWLCPGKPRERDLYFDAAPRPGIRFQWWIGDPRKPLPEGGPQDPAVRAFLKATLGLPALPRKDQPDPNHPEKSLPYYLLDAASFSGDTARFGVTVTITNGRDTVLAAMSWLLARPAAKVAVAAPPKPVDPCARDNAQAAAGPNLRSAGATGATGAPVAVDPALKSFRDKLTIALGCYSESRVLLRAFYKGTLTSGVNDLLAQQLIPVVVPRGAAPADQHAQLAALHQRLLTSADASKVVRELFAERAPPGTPLARLEGDLVSGPFRSATWTEALQSMDRHLSTGAVDATVEARTEATLFLLSRRGEWTSVRIVQQLAAFAPPAVGGVLRGVAPLYDDLPAVQAAPKPFDEAAPAAIEYTLDKAKQALGLLNTLGVPGADEVAASLGRIKTGVKFGSGAATQLDWLKEGFDALPPDSSVTRAKGALKELTRMYNLLATVAAEPDRLIGNARYEAAFQHFAERTASLPQVQGWIAADGDEVRRTTAEMVARRDTISLLRKGVEQRFGRPFERMLQECTPNLECFSGFADYKVRIEQQQYHIAHLLDERSANLVEQRALCWRVGQRGWSNPACPETVNRKG